MARAFDPRRGWNFGPAIVVFLLSSVIIWWPLVFAFQAGMVTARLPGPLNILLTLTVLSLTNRHRISVGRQELRGQRNSESEYSDFMSG